MRHEPHRDTKSTPKSDADAPKAGGYVVRDRRAAADADQAHDAAAVSEDVARLQREVQQAKDQALRALAEFENTKKRLQREKEEFAKFAAESLVRDLLPIVDSLSQALVAVDKQSDPEAVIKGVHLIYRQLLGLLEREGVQRIQTVGQRFDPHLHEAVAEVVPQDRQADGTIVEEVHVGYTMHGKVVRPAMVKVAKQLRPETGDQRPETQDTPKS